MNPDPFMSLDLWLTPQSPAISLSVCIAKNLEPERIEGFVDAEGNPKERILRFWNLPKILMINIKRYTPFGQKIRTPVNPNSEIDLSEYIIGYVNNQTRRQEYELFGAAIHSGGGINGGHYYAMIRTANGKWYAFNDTNVSEVKEDSPILNSRLSEASCFFYRKK
jgi:ubiquitin C-terminal hydrolase